MWLLHRKLRVSIGYPRFTNRTTLGVPLFLHAAVQPRTSQRNLLRWWLPSLNNFRLTSKIQTMVLASLTPSLFMNPINVLAFFSPWTSNRCLLSSPTMADYTLSPISLTKGLLRNHLHTRWFAWRSLNAFSFDDQHYRQIGGIAMGSRMGPNYACLFVGYIEE